MDSYVPHPVGEGRNWPFTLRITLEERRLLRVAANQQRTSVAELIRAAGLQSLIAELARVHE